MQIRYWAIDSSLSFALKLSIITLKEIRKMYTSSYFLLSMDTITGYNPQDAAGFIRINALR